MQDLQAKPFRRHVFFVSGFDPRGVLFLQKNCATETERWSQLTGYPVKMGARKSIGKLAKAWPINAELPNGKVQTDFEFMQWDDIIREHWERRNWMVYLQSVAGTFNLIRNGVYGHAIRESWPISVVMSVPTGVVIGHVLSALLLLGGIALLVAGGVAGILIGILLMAAAAAISLYIHANADRFKPEWNARIGLFAEKLATGRVDKIHQRLDDFADHIIATIDREQPDEALIIGHSFGTSLASILASRILAKRPDLGQEGSKLALVTLGQTQVLMARNPDAQWFRDELSRFAAFPDFTWLDFSSPPDGACYALINVLDFLDAPPKNVPRLLNAQFHKLFSEERMTAARQDRMIMHFYYLMSPDIPQPDTNIFDFMTLIAGPEPAAARYGKRPSGTAFFSKARR
jgi:pimeloyl-ACP methyl ester carboxylesterase